MYFRSREINTRHTLPLVYVGRYMVKFILLFFFSVQNADSFCLYFVSLVFLAGLAGLTSNRNDGLTTTLDSLVAARS